MSDLVDRRYVSRFSQPGFGLKVYVTDTLTDADDPPTVSLIREGETVADWTRTSEKTETGSYSVVLSSVETSAQMLGTLMWNYEISAVPQVYGLDIEVGPSAPAYDALPPAWQEVVEGVYVKFADLFDSPHGGPNLQVYRQTHFGRNRMAQLMGDAIQSLNSASSPHAHHVLGGDTFPFDEWGGLLGDSLYIEAVKHLIRSYVEQPEAVLGVTVSRLDRRDYMDRWGTVLATEQEEFERNLKRYRGANLGLGHVRVLVAGGAYGNWGPEVNPGGMGLAAARGYHWINRWH
jgi:hypothetical protein